MLLRIWGLAFVLSHSLLFSQTEMPSYLAGAYSSIAFGKTIGIDQNYISAGLFSAYCRDIDLYFIHGNWSYLEDNRSGANAGLGFRFGSPAKGAGIHFYADWLDLKTKDAFQISGGCEYWVCSFLFDLELYVPMKDTLTAFRFGCNYPGDYQFQAFDTFYCYRVATFSIGKEFNLFRCNTLNLYALPRLGSYWLSNRRDHTSYGGLLQLDLVYNNLLFLKGRITYDKIFNTRYQALVTVAIPFENLYDVICRCFSAFYAPPERFPIIVTQKKEHCTFNW